MYFLVIVMAFSGHGTYKSCSKFKTLNDCKAALAAVRFSVPNNSNENESHAYAACHSVDKFKASDFLCK